MFTGDTLKDNYSPGHLKAVALYKFIGDCAQCNGQKHDFEFCLYFWCLWKLTEFAPAGSYAIRVDKQKVIKNIPLSTNGRKICKCTMNETNQVRVKSRIIYNFRHSTE